MPKKRAPKYDTKPSSPAHPSLSSSKPKDAFHSLTSSGTPGGNSVNDQIQKLRLSERTSPSPARSPAYFEPGLNPSLPPSLRNILQLPDAPAPRPRPGLRVIGGRRAPGPAAPQSWLRGNQERAQQRKQRISTVGNGIAIQVEALPGAYLPENGSLVATTLKGLARNWDWHKVYDQYYIATIPVRYKGALLHYIAGYGEYGIDKAGLELLFQDEHELEGATGAEGLTHLHFARSIGYPLRFSDLKALLSTRQHATSLPVDNPDSPLESWDDTSSPTHPTLPTSPFSTLTHLSLAHPQPSTSAPWKHLLSLVPHLPPTLTHLSLAYWPPPTLTPNSTTAYRSTPAGDIPSSASTYYSHTLDGDFSEAASILRRLSKATYCLQWLDLTGCIAWLRAFSRDEVDWVGSWRALETVRLGQEIGLPGCFSQDKQSAWRDVYYRPVDKRGQEWNELLSWAQREREVIDVEKDINTRISYLRLTHGLSEDDIAEPYMLHQYARNVVERQGHYWQDDAARHRNSSLSRQPIRTTRVKFDRGWEDWGIREAVEEITAGR